MSTSQGLDDIFGAGKYLEANGHQALLPDANELSDYDQLTPQQIAERKNHYIFLHIKQIEKSDAILVTNGEKKGIPGYIGANTFLEMAIAMYLRKPIYVLNPVEKSLPVYEEVLGMQPTFLNGQLENLK